MPEELVVYCEADGTPTGETAEKLQAHNSATRLHLAFSCYVFNSEGKLLVTQRALTKKVYPGVWTNSLCGHPGPGEEIKNAIKRRLKFELGMEVTDFMLALPNYTYKTPPFNGIIEHEFCPVYVSRSTNPVLPNTDEVEAYKWMMWQDFCNQALADRSDSWSWWCKDQIHQMKTLPIIKQITQESK